MRLLYHYSGRRSKWEEVSDTPAPICLRRIGLRANGDFVSLDDRTTSAPINSSLIQSQACGNTGL
ncbi:MAG: hypothetical protein HYT87_01040 [Nitrospirae bacterium]|nr:hypothetical protein [Nitrospirota bacterium]